MVLNIAFAFPLNQAHWWIGLGLAGLGLAAYALTVFERRRATRLSRFVDARLAPRLLIGHNARMRRPLFWMAFLGFVFLAAAFAQPHWGQAWQEVHTRSHDVLVLLDISESMLAENPLPNRLQRAKQKIESILEKTPGDRFGLIVFSGEAQLLCPLTSDHAYYRSVLNAVDTNTVSEEGTTISRALDTALETFSAAAEETGDYSMNSRAILLISDGEKAVDSEAEAEVAAVLDRTKELSKYARCFVIGVGDPRGTEITYKNAKGLKETVMDGGKPHLSKLDEETLSRVAIEGGGGYIRSTAGNDDVDKIYGLIQQLEARGVSSDIRFQLVNRFQWPLALAIACFAGEGLWLALLPKLRSFGRPAKPEDGEENVHA